MKSFILQVRFPLKPGSMSYSNVASVRYVKAASQAEADSILRAEYLRRRVSVHSIRSFGEVTS